VTSASIAETLTGGVAQPRGEASQSSMASSASTKSSTASTAGPPVSIGTSKTSIAVLVGFWCRVERSLERLRETFSYDRAKWRDFPRRRRSPIFLNNHYKNPASLAISGCSCSSPVSTRRSFPTARLDVDFDPIPRRNGEELLTVDAGEVRGWCRNRRVSGALIGGTGPGTFRPGESGDYL